MSVFEEAGSLLFVDRETGVGYLPLPLLSFLLDSFGSVISQGDVMKTFHLPRTTVPVKIMTMVLLVATRFGKLGNK